MQGLQIVEANLPDPHPQGWRHYAAIFGPKWAHLVMLATGAHIKVPVDVAKRCSRPLQGKIAVPARVIKRLKRNAKDFGKDEKVYLKDMIAELKDAA